MPGTHAATLTVTDGITSIAGPDTDADLIGDNPTVGFSAPRQVSAAIHELTHLYEGSHQDGYSDNHHYINYISLIINTYESDFAGEDNNCGIKITHSGLNENRFVQGLMKCTVTNGSFPHTPARVHVHRR